MITSNNRLIVLEDFLFDWNLPKYKKPARTSDSKMKFESDEDGPDESSEGMASFNTANEGVNILRTARGLVWTNNSEDLAVQLETGQTKKSPSLLSKLAFWKKDAPAPVQELMPDLVSVEDFFASVKMSAQEITIAQERAAGYERALVNAKKAGQTALVEKLMGGLNAHKMEAQLVALGLNKFVAEDDIIKFYKTCKKGLRLDYVKNFTRTIPEDITAKKAHADELGIFDNYVVLHFDPLAKSWDETEAERRRRLHPDPILFGLMKTRRVLYFVGDWIDDVCNLTLDQLADVLGKQALQTEPIEKL